MLGRRRFGPMAQPPTGTFTSVGIVDYFRACGIRDDGSLECWGDFFQPKPTGTFVAVHDDCAIRMDGRLACWFFKKRVPSGSFSAVSGSCGIRTNASLACWYPGSARDLPLP